MQKHLLRELVGAGAVRAVQVESTARGYILVVLTEGGQRTLETQRRGVRLFRSLDAVASLAREVGIKRFDVAVLHGAGGARSLAQQELDLKEAGLTASR